MNIKLQSEILYFLKNITNQYQSSICVNYFAANPSWNLFTGKHHNNILKPTAFMLESFILFKLFTITWTCLFMNTWLYNRKHAQLKTTTTKYICDEQNPKQLFSKLLISLLFPSFPMSNSISIYRAMQSRIFSLQYHTTKCL